ncbi:MAG: class I SAM-dependent methyltransferase [Alphaproteobacteria bacterium]|nr:class I SAM-dependent methyltransferase [Alphaproteobacteria bacterium]
MSTSYFLKTGKQGSDNLDLQHELFKKESLEQLGKAGLSENMVVWDIACGGGIMTEYLAQSVGPNGKVYAIDISKGQINVAKDRIEEAGHKNVEFIVGDINDIDFQKYQKADLAFSRFILMHVTKPQKIIKIIASLLKPSGVISFHESSMKHIDIKSNSAMEELYQLIIKYGDMNGLDYDIGRKIAPMCEELKLFKKVESTTKIYHTTDTAKQLISSRIDETEDQLVKSGLTTIENFAKLSAEIKAFLKSDQSNEYNLMKEQNFILAYKA